MKAGRAGIQRRKKPDISIYVNVAIAKSFGLKFQHCPNDVIMCTGDNKGMLSPFFFHEIRNIHTGALVEFVKSGKPDLSNFRTKEKIGEVVIPPPAWATGIEPTMSAEAPVFVPSGDRIQTITHISREHINDATLQTELLKIYGKNDIRTCVTDFITLAKKWNASPVTDEPSKIASVQKIPTVEVIHNKSSQFPVKFVELYKVPLQNFPRPPRRFPVVPLPLAKVLILSFCIAYIAYRLF